MSKIRWVGALTLAVVAWLALGQAQAGSSRPEPQDVVGGWYKMVLELVRHTPTYSPPVASRSFAYIGVAAYEAVAAGSPVLRSLSGQLNALTAVPGRETGNAYDEAVVVNAAISATVQGLFTHTGPTGQRAIAAMDRKMGGDVDDGLPDDVVLRSRAYGRAVAEHILDWSQSDGGERVENMGFPFEFTLTPGPAHWVPTSRVSQQQTPLLPEWGKNRTFAMPDGAACGLPPPPAYSEAPGSAFHDEAVEVFDAVNSLTPEQLEIARFWSDDPMLSPTPPGHWLSIALEVLNRQQADVIVTVDTMARLGVALADAFIGCWDAKFRYDLVRPITYIHRLMDPKWEALLITPPFPEYPSGHSTQSGAAAYVLAGIFGENFAFEDSTHIGDGLPPRKFASFWAAAEEAGISRLYGGIHFRSAIVQGLDQGKCIGAYVNALKTRN